MRQNRSCRNDRPIKILNRSGPTIQNLHAGDQTIAERSPSYGGLMDRGARQVRSPASARCQLNVARNGLTQHPILRVDPGYARDLHGAHAGNLSQAADVGLEFLFLSAITRVR
jgi:hypothetical protein